MSGEPHPDVAELVPHGSPMLALERLVEWEPGRARLVARLAASHPFVRNGPAPAIAALEIVAQGVAACLGMDALRAGRAVGGGMVVACRIAEIATRAIEIDEPLELVVSAVRTSDAGSVFEGTCLGADGRTIVRGSFTLVHGQGLPS